jgi:hypothetical protein
LYRSCLLKHGIEGKIERRIEVKGRRGRRRKQILYDRKEKRGYWKLRKQEIALNGEVALEEAVELSYGRLRNA